MPVCLGQLVAADAALVEEPADLSRDGVRQLVGHVGIIDYPPTASEVVRRASSPRGERDGGDRVSAVRYVVYLRVSTDQQADAGQGLEIQEAACRQWLRARAAPPRGGVHRRRPLRHLDVGTGPA
jgi:hypothetical protein